MGRSLKGGLGSRRRSALARLEKQYETFKANKQDKPGWESTRNGFNRYHSGSTYAQECSRLQNEIKILKEKLQFS